MFNCRVHNMCASPHRTDPRAYAKKLEALVQLYDKTMYQSPTGMGCRSNVRTKPCTSKYLCIAHAATGGRIFDI